MSALDQLIADSAAEVGKAVTVTVTGRNGSATVTIPAVLDWGDGAIDALDNLNLREWASQVLTADDLKAWVAAGPNNRQALDALRQWTSGTGEDVGESSASQPSSETTVGQSSTTSPAEGSTSGTSSAVF